MNKIRVIDLLNKIANGEEVPKIIRYKGENYALIDYGRTKLYMNKENPYFDLKINTQSLHDELEIIEEDKQIEKLDYEINENNVDTCTKKIRCKINELVDKVNKLKKESDK